MNANVSVGSLRFVIVREQRSWTADETLELPGFQYKHGDRPLDGFTSSAPPAAVGFGEVYYALSDSGREVALKLVHTYEHKSNCEASASAMNLKTRSW